MTVSWSGVIRKRTTHAESSKFYDYAREVQKLRKTKIIRLFLWDTLHSRGILHRFGLVLDYQLLSTVAEKDTPNSDCIPESRGRLTPDSTLPHPTLPRDSISEQIRVSPLLPPLPSVTTLRRSHPVCQRTLRVASGVRFSLSFQFLTRGMIATMVMIIAN